MLFPHCDQVLAATSNEQENPLGDERFRETKNLADDEIAEVLEKEEEPPIQEFKSEPMENQCSMAHTPHATEKRASQCSCFG